MAIQGVNNSAAYIGNTVNTTRQELPAIDSVKTLGGTNNVEQVSQKSSNVSEQMMRDAVNEANTKLRISNRRCQFNYERDINRVSVKLIDEDTGEVIREIPSEETLDMIRRLKEMTGLLVDEQR